MIGPVGLGYLSLFRCVRAFHDSQIDRQAAEETPKKQDTVCCLMNIRVIYYAEDDPGQPLDSASHDGSRD